MTTPVTAQGPANAGMSTQQGYSPGFPPALGLEQFLGQPQQHGFYQPYGGQQSFQQPQSPWQQFPIQQITQTLVSQLLPLAQQVILPQVVATVTQQIPMYLQQIVAQQVTQQMSQQGNSQQSPFGQQPGWQHPGWQQQGWQQPGWQQFGQYGQYGQTPFGRGYQGSF